MKTHHLQIGFSLLELLTVMAIMALLSTLAVTGYFATVRGMLKQRAASGFANTLVLARQRACTDATKTAVICFNNWSGAEQGQKGSDRWKAARPSYVICRALGQFTSVSPGMLGDEFTSLDLLFDLTSDKLNSSSTAPIRIYNLTRGGWSDVTKWISRESYKTDSYLLSPEDPPLAPSYAPEVLLCFTVNKTVGVGWKPGDTYGVPVSPVAYLPRNIYFLGKLNPEQDNNEPFVLYFRPDGKAESMDGLEVELGMLKKGTDGSLTKVKTIRVSMEGDVSVESHD